MATLCTISVGAVCKDGTCFHSMFFCLLLNQFSMETFSGLCLLKQLILCEWKLQHDLEGAEQGQICFPHLLFGSQYISKYLKSWFSVFSSTTAVSTFLSEGPYQASTCMLFWLYCMRCWKELCLWQAKVFLT